MRSKIKFANIIKDITIKRLKKALAERDILIKALKKIRDSEESDLGVYAEFCCITAGKALEAIDSTSTPSTPEKQEPPR